MLNVITDNIDIWTSAKKKKKAVGRGSSKKFELYGIKKLRKLILDLALEGKLVSQDPNDEPASELLKKIEKEKKRLYEKGEIKKQQLGVSISKDNEPFMIPDAWEWVDLGSVGIGSTGKTPKTSCIECFDGVIPFLGPGQITPSGKILKADKTLTELGAKSSTIANDGDILMVCIGGSIGKSAIAREEVTFNQQINAIHPLIDPKYLSIAMNSSFFQKSILENASGTATPIINRSKWELLLVPIASLQEQHRIVHKVDNLMALFDQLEQEEIDSTTAHQTLVKTLLNALISVKTAEEFTQSWQRISEHFDILFTTEESIEELKQTILQLAVMGKLVPQDPNDEPVGELLKKIEEEKEQLVKEKKIKKPKKLPEINDDEKAYILPSGWEYVRLNDIGEWGAGATPTRGNHEYYGGNIPWFKSGELTGDYIETSEEHVTEVALKKTSLRYNKPGDVLLAMYGATIGKTSILKVEATTNQAVCACTPFTGINNVFLLTLLKAYKNKFFSMGVGGAQPNISREKIIITTIVLPPFEEQKRIVEKVYSLMALCDSLKANISEAQETQILLADTITNRGIA